MTEYICPDCMKNFGNKKDHLDRHTNKKKPCKPKKIFCTQINTIALENTLNLNSNEKKEEVEINKQKKYECKNCGYCFTRNSSLKRHLDNNYCNAKKDINNLTNNSNTHLTIQPDDKFKEFDDKLNLILKQNEELKKENEKLKKQIGKKKEKSDININIVNNNNVVNNNNANIVNFNNVDYNNLDKKLFVNPIMNVKLFGKEIILKMIENIYINENLPEYQNIVITDKNRGYVKVYNNGKWKTDNVQIINLVINGIIEHSKTILTELNQYFTNNIQATNRLSTSKKYIDLCDLEYLDELEDEQLNEEIDNKDIIKRCKDFREMVFKDTINLFHDNKNILIKPKKFDMIDL